MKKFKFDRLVLQTATVVNGHDLPVGTIIIVNGEKRQITNDVASMLVNSGKALKATDDNIAAIKKQVSGQANARQAKVKAAAAKVFSGEAKKAFNRLQQIVEAQSEQIAALTERLDGFEAMFVEVELDCTSEESADPEEGSDAGN
ncbi:MAG: hypothetical protein J7K75_08505 [Desulfuromonas sp.]|nr:hypothetical protein [Desulfuromonas sp.]